MNTHVRLMVYACGTRTLYGLLFLATVLYACAIIFANVGSGTILDTRSYPIYSASRSDLADSPNAVTAGAVVFSSAVQLRLIDVGRSTYSFSRNTMSATTHVYHSIGNAGRVAYTGTLDGASAALHKTSAIVISAIKLHADVLESVAQTPLIHNFLTPSTTMSVTTIDSRTSFELLEQYDQAQKQQLKKLLEAQVTANGDLGGQLAAGDPNRGGYPATWDNARQDSLVDSWGMFNRECVSYAAWKVHQTYGTMPYWGGIGNANQWVANAKNAGIPTGSAPKIGSVAISMEGYYGHAMWVDAVDGSMIHVSQYNFDLNGRYSEMWLDGSALTYIYFGDK